MGWLGRLYHLYLVSILSSSLIHTNPTSSRDVDARQEEQVREIAYDEKSGQSRKVFDVTYSPPQDRRKALLRVKFFSKMEKRSF